MPDNKDEKKKASSKDIKKKYANNPYVTGGREQWGEYFETKSLPIGGTSVKQSIYNAAKTTRIDPDLLYASAMEEGLREGIDDPGAVSEAYGVAAGWDPNPKTKKKQAPDFNPQEFPIDGFRTYGLDTFGDQFESLQRKGYLPQDFDKRFKKFKAINELDQSVNSAAFKTEEDALTAKAAMLRNTRDNLNRYTNKTNVPLTEKQRDFFTLVGYNAGEGNMQKMIKSYKDKGYLKDDKFLTDPKFKPASYAQPYTYAQRRLQNMDVMNTEGYFQDYTPPEQEAPQTPPTMDNGGKINKDGIKGPIGFLNSYYNSPEFKRRAGKNAQSLVEYANQQAANYAPHVMETDPNNIGSMNGDPVFTHMAGAPKGKNVIISKPQAATVGADPIQDVLPHEYSHWTRNDFTPEEDGAFVSRQKNKRTRALFEEYHEAPDKNDYLSFSQWMQAQDPYTHDLAPSESYSDLNTLRYMMFKQGIYDTRERKMTIDDFKKAQKDPWLKKQFALKRLLENFKPEDIVELNNEVAFQNTNENTQTMARHGAKIKMLYQDGGVMEDPTAPKGYKPLSQQNRQDWNSFVRYLNRDLKVGGSKELDNRSNSTGLNYLNDYKKNNPNFSITPEMVPYIQYEFQQLKNTNALPNVQPQGRVKTLVQNYFADRQVSPVDGWIGSLTSRQGFPEVTEFSDDPQKRYWGLDYEGASQFEQQTWNTRNNKGMNDGGYLTFNPNIYNDLYPNGEFTNLHMDKKFNNGGSIYDVVPNGFNPGNKTRKDPWTPYMEIANFGNGEGFYTEAVANSGIHIKPQNRGKFTAAAKRAGMGVQEYARHVLADDNASPTLKKRANFARNAAKWHKGNDGTILPFSPNAVSTPENPILYQDPLEEARKNIANFFNDPQNNQVINDASLNLNPDMQGAYEDTGFSGIEATPEQLNNANRPSTGQRIGQAVGNMLSGVSLSTAPLIMGTAAIANMATRGQQEAQEYARRVRRYSQQDVYNPIKYGTGSQAIYNDGGNMNGRANPNQVKMISDNQFSSPTYEFVGPSHEEGGIDISYAGNNVEVEGGETVFMDNEGDLNVFGNMYVPGTNKKFKTVSKNLSTTENKIQKDLDKSVNLVNENNPNIKNQRYSFNAGKVMMDANKSKLEELNQIKNELSDMQNFMLDQGFDEDSSKNIMNYGGKMKTKKYFDDGGELFNGGRDKKRRPSVPVRLMSGPSTPIKQPTVEALPPTRLTTIDQSDYTPPIVEGQDDPDTTTTSRYNVPSTTRRSSMPFGQILPELLTIATERPEFVPGQTYEPNLYTPYQVSFQDRLNENNSTFRALQLANPNNPALASQLAGQKYEADSRVLAEEFRTNQGIQNQITNQNIQLLNQAQQANIQLADQQFVRQSQARSNTRENIRNAINSISSKVAQARLEDQTLAVYENMFPHFTFNDNGKLEFQDVDRPVFTSGNSGSGNTLTDQRKRVKYDANGKVKETWVTTPSKRDMDKLDLQIEKGRTQRLGLFNSIFGGKRRK